MTRAELEFYSHNVPAIRNALERIANALEENNKSKSVTHADVHNAEYNNDIPGFEGTLDALENLTNMTEARDYYKEKYENTLTPTSDKCCDNDCPCEKDEYEYDLQGIRVDSDHDIRSTASYYENEELANGATKKSCILDYVTNEFGSHGARYTDIIKFAYYLGAHNAPKYDNSCRGYYAMAFNTRFGGHLIQGGKDQLVKGINKEGKERYYAHSSVDSFTDYYKTIE